MFRRLLTLIRKELQMLVHNPQSRRLLVVPVLLQIAIFPLAATLEVKNATIGIFNEDGGAPSVEIAQRLAAAQAFPYKRMITNEAELQKAIDRREVLLAVRMGPEFSRTIERGQQAFVQIIQDGRRSNSSQIASSYAEQIISQWAAEKGLQSPPAHAQIRHLYNPNLEYTWFILPALVAIITTAMCLMISGLSIAREREEGTLDQLLVTPLSPGQILIGKAVPSVLVAMFQASIIAVAAVWIYGVPMTGSLFALALAVWGFACALVGCGLFISAISSTQQQAFIGCFCFMVPSIVLSGYMAPIENMPEFLQWLAHMNPLTYLILMVKGIFLKGYGIPQIWPLLWPLLVMVFATFAGAYVCFRHKSGH